MTLTSAVPADVLTEFLVLVPGDTSWQQRARLLQSQWRSARALEPGQWPNDPTRLLGSRLTDVDGAAGRNFLTTTARSDAQEAVTASSTSGALVSEDRLLCNLLSSQPLCFNLFADLRADKPRATRVLGALWPEIGSVTGIEYEYSPGRSDIRYVGTRTAFDVFIDYVHVDGSRGFVGIEVKYHEDMKGAGYQPKEATRTRLLELTQARLGIGESEATGLLSSPLWQIWLDHLLAESMLDADETYAHGSFVFLYPEGNSACASAWSSYSAMVQSGVHQSLTLEAFTEALGREDGALADSVRERYIATIE